MHRFPFHFGHSTVQAACALHDQFYCREKMNKPPSQSFTCINPETKDKDFKQSTKGKVGYESVSDAAKSYT